jgi:hypothetical protein
MINFHVPNYGYYRSELINDNSNDKRTAVSKYFTLNFENLLNSRTSAKRPILLIGSGFSISSGIPNWKDSIEFIISRYVKFVNGQQAKYLIARGVTERARELFGLSEESEFLIDLAQFLKYQFLRFPKGKSEWSKILHDLFKGIYQPNNNHELLAEIFPYITGIITTNYDTLIEDSIFVKLQKEPITNFDLNTNVYNYYEHERLRRDLEYNPELKFIIKIHGCITDSDLFNNIIIGRKDYAKLTIEYGGIFKCISELYQKRKKLMPLISLGYSLNDRDMQNLMAYLEDKVLGPVNSIIIDALKYEVIINQNNFKSNDSYYWMNTDVYNMFYLPYPISNTFSSEFINFQTVLKSLNNYYQKHKSLTI